MKKKVGILLIVAMSLVVFIVLQSAFSVERSQKQEMNRVEDPYYQERISQELEMQEQGIVDATQLLEELKTSELDILKIEKVIQANLQYCFDNLSEMTKGDDADIEITKRLSYSLSFMYYSVMNCDYDHGKTHTENEKTLWDTNVYRFVSKAYKYFLDCDSLTQQEEDYVAAEKLAEKLDENLNKEIKHFVESLQSVVKEGAAKK